MTRGEIIDAEPAEIPFGKILVGRVSVAVHGWAALDKLFDGRLRTSVASKQVNGTVRVRYGRHTRLVYVVYGIRGVRRYRIFRFHLSYRHPRPAYYIVLNNTFVTRPLYIYTFQ